MQCVVCRVAEDLSEPGSIPTLVVCRVYVFRCMWVVCRVRACVRVCVRACVYPNSPSCTAQHCTHPPPLRYTPLHCTTRHSPPPALPRDHGEQPSDPNPNPTLALRQRCHETMVSNLVAVESSEYYDLVPPIVQGQLKVLAIASKSNPLCCGAKLHNAKELLAMLRESVDEQELRCLG